jgi:poly-gamma-glutamate capsule biosynthesis protein CapA/YwtB (metallophosphatase superfamily)
MGRGFFTVFVFFAFIISSFGQGNSFIPNDKYDSLRIMLVGDLLQSNTQIAAAYDNTNKYYGYSNCFRFVQPLFGISDMVIANLETTFSGKPYSSNPYYSAPDQFALALKFAGINCLMTANDHCADRDKEGIERTIHILDSFGIKHTGTFLNRENKLMNNPLVVERNGFKVAVLNYTFGTKYTFADSNMVNVINPEKIKRDLFETKKLHPDFTIVYMHWGTEYERFPNDHQRELAKLCFDNGADFVAGANPHVLQRAEELQFYSYGEIKKGVVAYSLGNFLSDYDRRYGDGSAIMEITLSKEKSTQRTRVSDYGFIPTFVVKDDGNGAKPMQVVPISEIENKTISVKISTSDVEKMKVSALDTRAMLNTATCTESRYKLNDDIINDVSETIMLTGAPVNNDKKDGLTFIQQKPVGFASYSNNQAKQQDSIIVSPVATKKIETTVETKSLRIASIDAKPSLSKSISAPALTEKVNPHVTPEDRIKDSMIDFSKKNITQLPINATSPTLVKNILVVNKLDSLISNELRIKDSTIAANTIKIHSLPIKTSTPTIVQTNIQVNKIEKIITSDTLVKSPVVVVEKVDTTVVPAARTLEDDIADLEEKFKKFGNITYKVMFYNMATKIEINTYYYKYLEGYESVQENGNWVYYLGNTSSFNEAKNRCLLLRGKGLKKIFIIPFVNGKKIEWTINF